MSDTRPTYVSAFVPSLSGAVIYQATVEVQDSVPKFAVHSLYTVTGGGVAEMARAGVRDCVLVEGRQAGSQVEEVCRCSHMPVSYTHLTLPTILRV